MSLRYGLDAQSGCNSLNLASYLGTALLAATVASGVAADQGETERGKVKMNANVAVTLSTAKQQYAPGEPIPVTITFKNAGDKPVSVVVRSAWLDHVLSLTDEQGHAVPETAHATASKDGAQAGRRAIRKLMPGESISDTIDLEKVFDLKKQGLYRLSSGRHVSEKDTLEDQFTVSSEPLPIKIGK